MGILDKIFQRTPKQQQELTIKVYGDEFSLSVYGSKIEQVVRENYHGHDTEDQVVAKIKEATGLLVGKISLVYDKHCNTLTVYYCCTPNSYLV